MRRRNTVLFAAGALMMLAGGSAMAAGSQSGAHEMTISLPNGGTAQIEYWGSQPPKVVIGPAPVSPVAMPGIAMPGIAMPDMAMMPLPLPMPSMFWPAGFGVANAPSFAALQRISAQMDRQMAAMVRQMNGAMPLLPSAGPAMSQAALKAMPPGSASYSMVSTASGNNVCSRSVEITRQGDGKPQVVRHSSGNCGSLGQHTGTSAPAAQPRGEKI